MVLVRTMKLSHRDFIRNAHNWVTIVNSGLFWQLDIWKMWQDLMERPDDPADDEGDHEGHPHARTHHHQDGFPTGSQNTSWWEVYLQWQAMVNQILNPQSWSRYLFTIAKAEVIDRHSEQYAFGGDQPPGPVL